MLAQNNLILTKSSIYCPLISSSNLSLPISFQLTDLYDFSEYISSINPKIKFIYGDIEKLIDESETKFDLIISNAAIQWIDDFENFVNSVKNTMYSGLATTASTANTLCTSLLLWGDLDSLDEQRNRINSVSISEVQTAFVRYINSDSFFWIAVVGPENEELLEEILNEK